MSNAVSQHRVRIHQNTSTSTEKDEPLHATRQSCTSHWTRCGSSVLEGKGRNEMLLPRQGAFQASGFNKHHLQEVTEPGSLACRLQTHRWAQSREVAHFSLHKH